MADKKKFEYDDFKYDDFTHDAYQESDLVKNAKTALDTHLAAKPGAYQSQWQTQLNDVMNKIMNRDPFTYDLNGDALYQQYKDKFTQQGKMAMGDAIGQASAMTGGYGNSYAQSVGQQMYQKELQNLNDIVPELYQMALSKYDMDTQNLHKQQALLGQMEDRDYGRYRDTVSDWNTERGYLADRYDTERNIDYSKYTTDRDFTYNQYSDDRAHDYGVYSDNKNLAYTDYRNEIADEQWQKDYEYREAQDKIADEQWQKDYEYREAQDKIANEQWEKTFAYQQEQDKKAEERWNKEYNATMAKNYVDLGLADDPHVPETPVDPPEEEVVAIAVEADLNELIRQGATKSKVKAYLRDLLTGGLITEEEYEDFIGTYAPVGHTY